MRYEVIFSPDAADGNKQRSLPNRLESGYAAHRLPNLGGSGPKGGAEDRRYLQRLNVPAAGSRRSIRRRNRRQRHHPGFRSAWPKRLSAFGEPLRVSDSHNKIGQGGLRMYLRISLAVCFYQLVSSQWSVVRRQNRGGRET